MSSLLFQPKWRKCLKMRSLMPSVVPGSQTAWCWWPIQQWKLLRSLIRRSNRRTPTPTGWLISLPEAAMGKDGFMPQISINWIPNSMLVHSLQYLKYHCMQSFSCFHVDEKLLSLSIITTRLITVVNRVLVSRRMKLVSNGPVMFDEGSGNM